MEIWHNLVEVWEYLVDHAVLFAGKLFGFDPKLVLPWAQLIAAGLASIVSLWGIANLWNHFDSRRRALLASFLEKEEKRILERKHELAEKFQRGRKTVEGFEAFDVHSGLDAALRFYDSGKIIRAERELSQLQGILSERREIASGQAALALKQMGAVHLFLGSIAVSKEDSHGAIEEFKKALACNQKDSDARKYMIEQMLALSAKEVTARGAHLDRAITEAGEMIANAEPGENEIFAEAYKLKGMAYLARGNSGLAREALKEAVNYAELVRKNSVSAVIYEYLGLAQQKMGNTGEARQAFGISIAAYENGGDLESAERVRSFRDHVATTNGVAGPTLTQRPSA